jgi:hypothetical protein
MLHADVYIYSPKIWVVWFVWSCLLYLWERTILRYIMSKNVLCIYYLTGIWYLNCSYMAVCYWYICYVHHFPLFVMHLAPSVTFVTANFLLYYIHGVEGCSLRCLLCDWSLLFKVLIYGICVCTFWNAWCSLVLTVSRAFGSIRLLMAAVCFVLRIWFRTLFYTFLIKWQFGFRISYFWQCVLKVLLFNHRIFTILLCVWLPSSCHDRCVLHCATRFV